MTLWANKRLETDSRPPRFKAGVGRSGLAL